MSLSNGVTIDVHVDQTSTGHHVSDRRDRSHASMRAETRHWCEYGRSLPNLVASSIPHGAIYDEVSGLSEGAEEVPWALPSVSVGDRTPNTRDCLHEAWKRGFPS
jgi:hypothetical protein